MGHGFRPLICKIEIKSPNRKGTKIANRNLLHYIATREGVDLTRVNSVIDAMNENYDLTEKGEAAVAVEAPDEEYLKYMTFRPRSHGLFGNIDTENFSDVSKKLDIASSEKKTIYRGVISLSEMDGKALGYNNSGKWNLYLSSVMPDIASTLGISPNQVTWVAAFHAEQTHPHVHFMLWANQDQVKNAYITRTQQHKCREICQDAMFTDENEAIIRQITEAERKEIYKLQNASRNEITSYFKNIFEDTSPIPGAEQESMPGRLSREEHNKLTQLYKNILDTLPGTGRLHYKFMPPECKAYIDQVSQFFLKRPDIKSEYNQYLNAIENIHKILGKTVKEIEEQKVKSTNELYSRTGNIVLRGVLNIRDSILNPTQDLNNDTVATESDILEQETLAETFVGENKVEESEKTDYLYNLLNEESEEYNPIEAEKILLDSLQENNNPETLFLLGKLYSSPISIMKNHEKAVFFLEEYIKNNTGNVEANFEACVLLGRVYSDRNFDSFDDVKAEEYYQRAIALKPRKSNFLKLRLSRIYANKESELFSYDRAVNILEGASDYVGSVSLQKGNIYVSMGNQGEALEQYKVSAGKENAYAAFQMGRILLTQNLSDEQIMKAINYLEFASVDVPEANVLLGKIYMSEECVKDSIKAEKCLLRVLEEIQKKEGKKFHVLSEHDQNIKSTVYFRLGNIYADSGCQQYNLDKAVNFYEQSISAGKDHSWSNISSRIKLAKIYSDLQSPLCDFKKAIGFLKNIENKTGYVNYQIGEIYANKLNPNADLKIAVQYYEKALENSDISGYTRNRIETKLGDIYANEKFLEYDMKKALNFYKAAADNNDTTAMVKLAKCYLFGLGVESDKNMAKHWLERAGALGDTYANEYMKKLEDIEFKNFSYSMLRQIFSSMQKTKIKKMAQLHETEFRSSSKQARKEEYIHRN